MFKKESNILKQERNTKKNQKKENQKKEYFATIEIIAEMNQDLEKERLTQRILAETISENSQQIQALKAEMAILNSKLETENENGESSEEEVEDYDSRLAVALQDRDQSQITKRDLELTFQKLREEWFHLQEQSNFHVATLTREVWNLSQKLSKTEDKFNNLQTELQHMKDMLRENTSLVEACQRQLSQVQWVKDNMQEEHRLIRQWLLAKRKVKMVVTSHDQFQERIKRSEKQSEKEVHRLREREKEVISECSHLKDRVCQYESETAAREFHPAQDHRAGEGSWAEIRDRLHKVQREIAKIRCIIQKQVGRGEHRENLQSGKCDKSASSLPGAEEDFCFSSSSV